METACAFCLCHKLWYNEVAKSVAALPHFSCSKRTIFCKARWLSTIVGLNKNRKYKRFTEAKLHNCWQKVLVKWQKREKRLWRSKHLTITMLYLVILETEVVMGTATGRRTAMVAIMAIASKVFRSSKD